jgi:NAD(P)H-dependent FMN reductase/catechol 2,3-dioxygenase-like lactoylglutathione lyase family enzyme
MKKLHVGLLYGSHREGRFCDTVAAWARERIDADGRFSVDVLDPHALGVGSGSGGGTTKSFDELRRRIGAADAFVIVTPEYNHGYPAVLKLMIDSADEEWRAKPVAFVSYGGISGGLRAVEQLRLVFAGLSAVTVRTSVSFANARDKFDATGRLLAPGRPGRALTALLDELSSWAALLAGTPSAAPAAGGAGNPRLEHANLVVRDIGGMIRFLKAAFPEFVVRRDVTTAEGDRWVHVGTADTYVALNQANADPAEPWVPYSGRPGVNHLGYEVDDVEAVRARLWDAGFRDSAVPNRHPYRKRVYFLDPEGNDWEFVEYVSNDPRERNDYVLAG